MMNTKKIILALVSSVAWFSSVMAGEAIQVAEYRADTDPARIAPGITRDIVNASELRIGGPSVDYPWETNRKEFIEGYEGSLLLGRHTLSGVLDVRQSQGLGVSAPLRFSQSVIFGPKYAFSPRFETLLYRGYDRDDVMDAEVGLGRYGESDTTRTGLAQIIYLADRRAAIRLGYEFEQANRQDLYTDGYGHSLNVSGRFPLFWGLRASVEADYGRFSYPEYEGVADTASNRHQFRAAISHSLTERLHGGMQYSYLNEDFDDAPLSYQRHTWGLNFRYDY